MYKFYFILFLVVIISASCGLSNKNRNTAASKNEKENSTAGNVIFTEVKKGVIENHLEENGEIKPRMIIKIKFDYSGRVAKLLKEAGDYCRKDEVIAMVEPDLEQIKSYSTALITYQKALFDLQKISNEMIQTQDLYEKKLVSKMNYETVLNLFKITAAELKKTIMELDALQKTGKIEGKKLIPVRSPVSGTIINRRVDVGDTIIGTVGLYDKTVLFDMTDIHDIIIQAEINENDIIHIRNGEDVALSIEALPDMALKGKVFRVFPTPVERENIKKYVIQINPFEGFPQSVKPGMSVKIKVITVFKTNILVLPLGSVIRDADKKMNYVLIDNNTNYRKLFIQTGESDNNSIEIKKGLKEGRKVVINPFVVRYNLIEEVNTELAVH